jgi:glycosyltransferase involved in cell wall biosynthesis
MPSTVTILTSGPLCRNPRVLKEAHTLAQAGKTVTVITIAHHAHYEQRDSQLLAEEAFTKVALDRMSSDLGTRLVYFAERLFTWFTRKIGWEHPARLGPYHALKRLTHLHRSDLLIVHTELPMTIGGGLLRKGWRVAADFEDWHSQDLLPSAQHTRPLTLLQNTEAALLRNACHTTTTSHAMARALARHYNAPQPKVVHNTFPLSPAPSPAHHNPVSFVWLSQTIGPGRGLEAFLQAWNGISSHSRVVLVGNIDAAYHQSVLSLLDEPHQAALKIQPPLPPGEIPEFLKQHDVGLALEPQTPPNKDLTISNKLFHYFDAGLAVIATPTAGQTEVLDRVPRVGILEDFSDLAAATEKIRNLIAHPDTLKQCQKASRQAAESHFNWSHDARVLLETVDSP